MLVYSPLQFIIVICTIRRIFYTSEIILYLFCISFHFFLFTELESQSPSLEDDETAEYFPRTKETIQMLSRDLDTMGEMGVVT